MPCEWCKDTKWPCPGWEQGWKYITYCTRWKCSTGKLAQVHSKWRTAASVIERGKHGHVAPIGYSETEDGSAAPVRLSPPKKRRGTKGSAEKHPQQVPIVVLRDTSEMMGTSRGTSFTVEQSNGVVKSVTQQVIFALLLLLCPCTAYSEYDSSQPLLLSSKATIDQQTGNYIHIDPLQLLRPAFCAPSSSTVSSHRSGNLSGFPSVSTLSWHGSSIWSTMAHTAHLSTSQWAAPTLGWAGRTWPPHRGFSERPKLGPRSPSFAVSARNDLIQESKDARSTAITDAPEATNFIYSAQESTQGIDTEFLATEFSITRLNGHG
ncbi:uncharacterized protein [Dermacentor albipictus]|uniref:uncharacterized protein n=1 Tax=Dermacentor albipictus TaxID=60249 RepID=UPI0038FC515B